MEVVQGIVDTLRGQTIVDVLIDDSYFLWKIKILFSSPPTYEKYIELDIAYRQMNAFNYPSSENWRLLIQFITKC